MPDSPRNGAPDSPASRPVDKGDTTNSVTPERTAVQTGGDERGIMRVGSGNEVSLLNVVGDQKNSMMMIANLEATRGPVPAEFGATPEITSLKAEDAFPRLIKDPAQRDAFFAALSSENNLGDGKTGPFVFVKADAKPGEKGYSEVEVRMVTAEDVKNGTNTVSSSENESQILKEGDYKIWKLTNGARDGQPWALPAESLAGEDARYKFAREEGNGRLIYSSKAVPTPMAPLSQPRGLELSWGVQTGGPGALMAEYKAGDHNIITNYDLARLYEKGANPESQATIERIKKMVETSFDNLRKESGKQVPQQDGTQRWQFPEEPNARNGRDGDDMNTARKNFDRAVTDAATKLGIKITVVVGDVAKTVTPGMSPDEFRVGLENSKRSHYEMARMSKVEPSKVEGRTVYNFGSDYSSKEISELASITARTTGENIRVKFEGAETEIRPGTTASEAQGLMKLSSAAQRATSEYFNEREVPDAEKRTRLQSLNMRSEMLATLPLTYEGDQARLLKLLKEADPANHELLVRTQDGVKDKIVPLSPEEVKDLGRARVERANNKARLHCEGGGLVAELGEPRTGAPQTERELVVTKPNGQTETLKPGTLKAAVEVARILENDPDPAKQNRGKQFMSDLNEAQRGNNKAGLRVLGTVGTLIGLAAFLPAGAALLESQRRDFKPASVGSL